MDKLFEATLDAAALRGDSFLTPPIKPGDKESVATAFEAQELLRAAVEWHQRNEGEMLPTPLLAILCAARRVC